MTSDYLLNLTKALAATHKCRLVHFGTEKVTESFDGLDVWTGDVEIFQLVGHPKAQVAYGWAWKDINDRTRYTGILRLPPIQSALDAVKAAIASGEFG